MVKILFAGDYYPYQRLEKFCINNNDSYKIFGELLKEIKSADISGINIEFPITDYGQVTKKTGPNLKGNSITIEPLCQAGFNLAYISNNHTLDYGAKGMSETIANLEKRKLSWLGAGGNLALARKPLLLEIKGIKLAFLNFSENEFNVAKENSPGANPLNIINNIQDIRTAKRNADFVFVIVHAGQDFNHYPPPFLIKQLRFYAEEGASAIICHHSHYIAGYEDHQGTPIFYGLGNIIYPNKVEVERQKTLIINFTLNKDRLEYEVHPYYFNNDEMYLHYAGKGTKYDFTDQIKELSNTLKNFELNKSKWLNQLKKEEYYRYIILIGGYPQYIFKILKKLRCLYMIDRFLLVRKKKYYTIWNLLRRETHRDALLHIFEDKFDK